MSSMIEQIFLQILDMSIVAGYCILAVLVIRWLFKKAPKRYTYMLWIVVAFRLLCPLSIESAFSVFNLKLMPEKVIEQREEQQKEQQSAQLGMSTDMQNDQHLDDQLEAGEPVVGEGIGKLDTPGNQAFPAPGSQHGVIGPGNHYQTGTVPEDSAPQSGVNAELNQQGGNQSGALSQPQSGTTDQSRPDVADTPVRWSQICAWVWVGGMAALAVCMLVSWIRLKYQIRFAAKIKNGVYEVDGIASAFVLGVIRPRIYLPVGLTKLEQSWILLHENCHKWRKDYLIKMVASMLTAVYWFNPLIWVAWICFCCDMEMSCDEMALEGASPEMRKAYSRTLLSVASDRKGSWHISPAFGENSVKRRIKHILSFRKPAVWVGAVFAAVLVAVLVVFGTNGQANENDVVNGETVGAENSDETQSGDELPGENEKPEGNAGGDIPGGVINTGSGFSRNYRDTIYQKESVMYDVPYHVADVATNGEVVYLYSSAYGEQARSSGTVTRPLYFALTRCKTDGSQMKTIYNYEETVYGGDEINRENGERIDCMEVDEDGNLIFVMRYKIAKVTSYKLIKWDVDGNELWAVDIPEEGNGVWSMVCAGDNIVLNGAEMLYVFDLDGQFRHEITFDKADVTRGGINFLHVTRDNQVCVSYNRVNSDRFVVIGLCLIDLENGTIGADLFPFWESYYSPSNILPGKVRGYDFDFIVYNQYSMVGWNIGDELCTEVVNFVDSDIDVTQYVELKPMEAGKILAFNEFAEDEFELLSKVDPQTLPDKQVVTVSYLYSNFIRYIRAFNQSSNEYHIKIWDYSVYGEEATTKLNEDIALGNGPDMLRIDANGSLVKSYIRQGVLEDLYPWFNGDTELQQERFLDNVIDAFSVNGSLYQMPLTFEVESYAAKTAVVGEEPGWTIEEMRQLMKAYPGSRLLGDVLIPEAVLEAGLRHGEFVDEVNGISRFDSKEFIELLEWAAEYSTPQDAIEYSLAFSLYQEEKVLLYKNWFTQFDGFRDDLEKFGEEVTYIGFPGGAGNGAAIKGGVSLAMTAESQCKEGAWQFIRSLMAGEYQESIGADTSATFAHPINLNALEIRAEESLYPENYNRMYYYIGDTAYPMKTLTREQADEYIEYLKTLSHLDSLSYEFYIMVVEEAKAFFNGERSAADVAAVIQSRAKDMLIQ